MLRRLLGVTVMLIAAATIEVQAQTIKGVLKDDLGYPIPGASVIVDGTTTGVATDTEGKYELKLTPGQHKVRFSFVGFEPQERIVDLTDGQTMDISFSFTPKVDALDEIVVVGYGVQRKREVTGSISKIETKAIEEIPAPSFEASLHGQAAGVQVIQGSGMAGSPNVIRIRGIASISAAGDPLIVVDGIPISNDYFINESGGDRGGMNNNPLAAINPNDIESIEVLKDAAATGIYGSRGANGVILITTKRGRNKGLEIEFNNRVGVAWATAKPNMLNSSEFLQLYQEAWENDGGVGRAPIEKNLGVSWEDAARTNTNWVDETMGMGVKNMHSLSIRKGTEKWNSYFNLTYDNNRSYLVGNNYERISGRANVDYQFSDKLKVGVNTSLSRGKNNRVDAAWSGGLGAAMSTALPIYPIKYEEDVYDDNGELIHSAGDYFVDGSNPVRDRELKSRRTLEWRSINAIKVTYEPVKNLFLNANVGYEHMDIKDDLYESGEFLIFEDHAGRAKRYPTWINNMNYSLTANYLKTYNEVHKFNFLLGNEYQLYNKSSYSREEATDMPGPFWQYDASEKGEKGEFISIKNPDDRYSFISWFGRVHYTYNNKYIAQLTGRVDGSSKFGPNNKYGFFPSGSLGWIMSEEDFMKGIEWISYTKWKVSYGVVGNANIPSYQYFGAIQQVSDAQPYNSRDVQYAIRLENPDLKWETSNVLDLGVELGFWGDRVTAELGYYDKQSSDVLLNLTPPSSIGYDNYWANVAKIRNWGLEFTVKTINIDKGDFRWNTNFNIAHNNNKILDIGPFSEDAVAGGTNDTRVVPGNPVGTNYLVRFSHVDPANGRPVYIDKDGNSTYEWNPDDRVPVGDVLPRAVGGFENTFTYKRWGLGVMFYFSFGGKIYDSSSKRQLGVVTNWNMRDEIFDRWRQEGDNTKYPRMTLDTRTYGSGTPWINTDLYLHPADYIRLRNLSVSYTFDPFNIGRMPVKSCRLVLNATNWWTWTRFPGLDPEIARDFENQTDRNMSPNITYLTPPQEKTINLAVNFMF
jgi:TonB-linked SusC/RagA family outer membrane protein